MVAIRVADLRSPARHGGGRDGRTALTAAGAGPVRSGDLVVFCKPVAVAPALVRRDGRVQAAGHPADHVRLGAVEQQLDEMTGMKDTIGQVAAQVRLRGAVKGTARRAMTAAAALRGSLLMTLMPDADYAEILAALFGDLAAVPWRAPFTVPGGTVFSAWREAAGPEPLAALRDLVLAASAAEHEEHDWRAVEIGDLRLGSVDGSLTRMPDTEANRAVFSSAAGDDAGPYPQLRDLLITDASTRGTLAVVTGPSGGDKAEAEQQLLDRALAGYPHVFTRDRIWVLDRNFPGVARIRKMTALTHVLIRLRSSITLRRAGGFFPDGSWLADVSGRGETIRMRIIKYDVDVDGQHVPDTFCLATDLLDWSAYPAAVLAAAYKWRWDGSETALRENKSAIRGAGPSTGPIFRSGTPEMIRAEHAAWITACELVRAMIRAAARQALPARKGRRAGQPVHPREISFTAARRAAITAARDGTATASLPAAVRHGRRDTVLHQLGRRRITTGRDRHRDHKTKAPQAFHAAGHGITTRTAPARITICGPLSA
jgi:hypothetical protein